MPSALDMAGLLELLDQGRTILVPTPLAARSLREHFDRRERSRGLLAWEPPSVLTWSEWTASLWSALTLEGLDDRTLLNRLQEEALWSEIIAATPQGTGLAAGSLREITGLAASALALVAAHLPPEQLGSRLKNAADTSDSRSFVAWQIAFAAHCDRERLLPRALLEHALARHSREGRLVSQTPVHLAGFEHLTPSQAALLNALEVHGCAIHSHRLLHPRREGGLRVSVHAGSPQDELRWAVRWLRHRYEQDPSAEISAALLAPNPVAERPALEPLLRELLAPELERIDADLSSTPWHITPGPSLSSVPIVQHALLLLRWAHAALPLDQIGRILLSPFFFHADALEARARFEMHTLRQARLLRPELSLQDTLNLARKVHRRDLPPLVLNELRDVLQLTGTPSSLTGTGTHGDWAELLRKLLRAAGWPGPRTLSPGEFRATEAWEGLLDHLATLDLHGRRLSYADLLELLEHQAASARVQGPTASAPLEVSTLGDVEGCLFDAVLVLRSTDQMLPPPERPHPLLGWALQLSLGLPGVDPAAAHGRTLDALRNLRGRCGDLLLLAAAQDENGALRLTPLAREFGLEPRSPLSLLEPETPAPPLALLDAKDTEPLPPLPDVHVHGGARVLELQAACGFRAFASLRLGAEAPESRSLGLDARERGQLLHRAMELLWTEWKTRKALEDLTEDQRRAPVQHAVSAAFRELRARNLNPDGWTAAYLDILEERLTSLILCWLPFELRRSDFTVLEPEQKQPILVGPLELLVRPDRIDRVEDGFVYVDYKTAFDLNPRQWLGERPDAPQLPLYALLAEPQEVRGVAFARLRPGEDMAWLSLEDRLGIFPAKRPKPLHDIAAEMELWRAELDRLAYAFAEGEAGVDPKLYPRTCQHCEHRLLCRLDPAALLAGAAPAEPEVSHG